ncbi:Uncharacterized protein APZ42_034238 [Daphnia magna]|uniref:Ricin B lectin domain-containing protein n=1 Tax=Daphnia magna TaxID=35525 RepID=A0A164KBI8_9CRUS|nr:Uncharacterized protein APZ42_034238 [Daphnia magna]
MEKKLLLICILTKLQTAHTIFSYVCDCNYVKTRGILDINSPYYCKNPSTTHQPRFLTNYTLMTKQNPVKLGKDGLVNNGETTTKLYKNFKTSLPCCENQVNVDTWSCNEYADPVASKVKRSTNNEIEFFDNRAEKEAMGKRLYSISYAWGSIRMGHPIITNIRENGIMTKKDTIAYLMVDGSSTNTQVSIHNQYDIQNPLPTGTKFEYILDHSIRLINTNICIVTKENNQIMAENCTENISRWILDLTNYQWISLETGLCITLHDEEEGRVRLATLKTCSIQGTISESR